MHMQCENPQASSCNLSVAAALLHALQHLQQILPGVLHCDDKMLLCAAESSWVGPNRQRTGYISAEECCLVACASEASGSCVQQPDLCSQGHSSRRCCRTEDVQGRRGSLCGGLPSFEQQGLTSDVAVQRTRSMVICCCKADVFLTVKRSCR